MLEIIIQQATVPVVVDAGIGVPSYAAQAPEMGADAVLVNTAIAVADDPVNSLLEGISSGVVLACLPVTSLTGQPQSFCARATSLLTGFLEARMHENLQRSLATTDRDDIRLRINGKNGC